MESHLSFFIFIFILVMVVDPVFSKMQSVNIENSGGMLDTRQEYTLDVIPVHWVMCKNLHTVSAIITL